MPIDLKDVASDTATTTVDWSGQSADITYYPNIVTTEMVQKVQATEDVDEMAEFMARCIKDWDIKTGTKKVPVTAESFKALPISLVRAIFYAIAQDSTDPGEA